MSGIKEENVFDGKNIWRFRANNTSSIETGNKFRWTHVLLVHYNFSMTFGLAPLIYALSC